MQTQATDDEDYKTAENDSTYHKLLRLLRHAEDEDDDDDDDDDEDDDDDDDDDEDDNDDQKNDKKDDDKKGYKKHDRKDNKKNNDKKDSKKDNDKRKDKKSNDKNNDKKNDKNDKKDNKKKDYKNTNDKKEDKKNDDEKDDGKKDNNKKDDKKDDDEKDDKKVDNNNENENRAICYASGYPHYKTFDQCFYDFQGNCEYILTKPCNSDNFSVIVRNRKCNTYVTCTEQVTVLNPGESLEIILGRGIGGTVMINDEPTPHSNDGFILQSPAVEVVRTGGRLLVILINDNVIIFWDG